MHIRRRPSLHRMIVVLALVFASQNSISHAQPTNIPVRVTQLANPPDTVLLHGNTHPLARAEYDRGALPDSQPLSRMLLLLQRSPEQEMALEQFLEDQQNKLSSSYHHWLTPEQFGAQYGPTDGDIQVVTAWLSSRGFTQIKVVPGRNLIEFSGNVAQIRNAFGTEIHRYVVNAQSHIANASDPQIPAALVPIVAGIVSLHDFRPAPHIQRVGSFHKSKLTGAVTPLFTPNGTSQFFPLAPADFAKIYNVAPLWTSGINGTGQTIAVLGESNIKLRDIIDFRTIFGLPQNFSAQNIILNGPDPGLNSSELEADLDIQWTGAVAPGATIDFVTSTSTETTSGIHLSAVYAVVNNLAAVISVSFGACEQALGSTGNQFFNSLWQQAAAQGITVVVSAGDSGSAGCDDFETQSTANGGLAVSGLASTPLNVAVGGTDFDQINKWSQYWSASNDPVTHASALSYVPEIPWNDSCAQLGLTGCGSSAPNGSLNIVSGSGGPSTQYVKPPWQSATGVPSDGKRDVPDVSLFASNGFTGSLYIVCNTDSTNPPEPNCNLSTVGFTFQGVGGTSAAAPAFAGIMALVNQKQSTAQVSAPRQGNANYVLYPLANKQAAANPPLNCNSLTGPASGCTFNDITKGNSALANGSTGTNSVPCIGGSLNCSSGTSGVNGVLVTPASGTTLAWTTTPGYDLPTGLGSVNAQNLVNNWGSITFSPSATTLAVNGGTASITGIAHGTPVSVNSTVSAGSGASGSPSGQVALVATPNPTPGNLRGSLGIESLALISGSASSTSVILPGGPYNLSAHYQGDGTFGPSDSSPAIPINITAENSKTLISIPVFDPTTGKETGNTPSTLVYGTPYIGRVDVGNASAALSFPPTTVCTPPSCPTGTITWTDALKGSAPTPLDGGSLSLNPTGFADDLAIQLLGGSHVLSASYAGDNSFAASSSTYSLSVTPAPTTTGLGNPPMPPQVATPFFINAIVQSHSSGAMPSCNVTVFEGSTPVPGTLSCSGQSGGATFGAFLQPSLKVSNVTSGTHVYTVKFNGDSNYAPSTSPAMTTNVFYGTTISLAVDSTAPQYGSNITLTAIVDTTLAQGPALPNVVSFSSGMGAVSGTVTYKAITDAAGNLALQASVSTPAVASTTYFASFGGDSNYFSSGSNSIFVSVTVPDFNVSFDTQSLTLSSGGSASANITVTPTTTITSNVQFNCSDRLGMGLPCAASPNPVTLTSGSAASSVLTLSCPAPSSSNTTSSLPLPPLPAPHGSPPQDWWFLAAIALLVCLAAIPRRSSAFLPTHLGARSKSAGWSRWTLPLASLASAIFLLATGCGGGGGGGGSAPGPGNGGGAVPSSISVTVSDVKLAFGANITLTAAVTSSKTPTGTVTFLIDGPGGYANNALVSGTTTLQLNTNVLGVGAHQIQASYTGDASTLPSQTQRALTVVVTGSGQIQMNASTSTDVKSFLLKFILQ